MGEVRGGRGWTAWWVMVSLWNYSRLELGRGREVQGCQFQRGHSSAGGRGHLVCQRFSWKGFVSRQYEESSDFRTFLRIS